MRMARQIQTWTCILSARDAASSARGTRLPSAATFGDFQLILGEVVWSGRR